MTIKIHNALCTGCKSCEVVCSASHVGQFNPERSRIRVVNKATEGESRIAVCRLCPNPACVKACTYEACTKDETANVIRVDYEACVGCYACVEACPFHAIFIDPVEHVPLICDHCGGDPTCVKFCYQKAIHSETDVSRPPE
jgi:Fe-S-cluster-containing hydrogenase component 2